MRTLLIVGAALAGVLLFLLATASAADATLLAQHYPLLLGLNALPMLDLLGIGLPRAG